MKVHIVYKCTYLCVCMCPCLWTYVFIRQYASIHPLTARHCHGAGFVVTGGTVVCLNELLRCHRRRRAWAYGGSGFSVSILQITQEVHFIRSTFDIEYHHYCLRNICICLRSFYMIFQYFFLICFLLVVRILCFVSNDEIKLWNLINRQWHVHVITFILWMIP